MAAERFVVLGLAHARSAWFRSLGHWANSGALPVEFHKCVSAEEVRARLGSGRPFSALVADAGLPALDRDLVAGAVQAGCNVLVVDDGRARRDWEALGVSRVLPAQFDRDDLLAALTADARRIRRGAALSGSDVLSRPSPPAWRGLLAAVTGAGGTGASTAAMALAQAFADDARLGRMVVLADFRLHAELAMLHDARHVAPTIQEMVEAHRSGEPTAHDIRSLTLSVPERGYHVLLGLRQARFWPAIRPRAFEAALDGLRQAFRVVVADVDADLEGESDGGSIDIEERHVMARTTARRADVIFVVGLPTLKGMHGLVRVVAELLHAGVGAERIVPVVNRSPRSPRARASLAATLAELSGPGAFGLPASASNSGARIVAPVHLPTSRVEPALVDGTRLPAGIGAPLASAFHAVVERLPRPAVASADQAEPVLAGSLGRWSGSFGATEGPDGHDGTNGAGGIGGAVG